MATLTTTKDRRSEIGIFARLLENGRAKLSPSLARYILTLGFDSDDQHRMAELAERNQAGHLAADEHEELMSFVKVGHLLALLHSRARKALKKR
ncbi:MAG TPA: hypothetical protein VKS79_09885 [Gemmataceae bacterium]|nr:hypothetical protein [Gemmataceae bacterium]